MVVIVFILLHYASKALDRLEYVKLFNTLRDRKMCPIVLRLIEYVNKSRNSGKMKYIIIFKV